MFTFEVTDDFNTAQSMSQEDPCTPFPEIRHLGLDECSQMLVNINHLGQLIGFALVVSMYGSIEIFRFFIRPAFRNRGVGGAAAEALARHLIDEGIAVFSVEAIDERAESLWRRALAKIPHIDHGIGKFTIDAS